MLVKITATLPLIRRRGPREPGELFQNPRTKTVIRDFPQSPLKKGGGFMAALRWAQGEFSGASISFTTIKMKLEDAVK